MTKIAALLVVLALAGNARADSPHMERLLKTVDDINAQGGTQIRVKNVRDPEAMHRFLLSGAVTEYTNRAAFLAAVDTDFLVTFDGQDGLLFRDSAKAIKDTSGNTAFTVKGSFPMDVLSFTTGSVVSIPPNMVPGDAPYAWLNPAAGSPVDFTFPSKITAFGADIVDFNQDLGTRFEVDVVCPSGDLVLSPDLPQQAFYGFSLDGDAAMQLSIMSNGDGNVILDNGSTLADTMFWDNIVGRFMVMDKSCQGCGDPHFLTWGQEWFDFHGICDLVFLSAPGFSEGLGLDIHVRTKGRYQYSYIESVAIKIGDDLLEIASWGDYMINGIGHAKMPYTIGDKFSVDHEIVSDKKHKYKIQVSDSEAIIVSTHKDMVNIQIANATESNFGSSVGMMGTFQEGLLLARDGATIMDNHDLFGQEWQVTEEDGLLFQQPSPYDTCMPPILESSARRLGEATVTEEAAAMACSHHEEEAIRDMCVFDIIAMDDMEAGEVHGAF